MKDSSKLIGQGGSTTLSAGESFAGEFYLIAPREDTTISVLTRTLTDGSTTDALTSTETNLSGKTAIFGDLITPVNTLFTAITVLTGSVNIYRG